MLRGRRHEPIAIYYLYWNCNVPAHSQAEGRRRLSARDPCSGHAGAPSGGGPHGWTRRSRSTPWVTCVLANIILKNKMLVHDIDIYKSVPKNKQDLSAKGRSHIPYEWNSVGEKRLAQARERCKGPSPWCGGSSELLGLPVQYIYNQSHAFAHIFNH